jgi:hypothetical protein
MAPARRLIAAALLVGPFALACRGGGYFAEPRLWAGLVACAALAVAALSAPLPSRRGWVAILALAAFAGWTALSGAWAPLSDPAVADAQRVALYAAAFAAAVLTLGSAPGAVEPALAAGCALVVAYGLSERVLPGLIELDASRTAFGRLEQPLTYWNAMGAVASIGLVLATALAGDLARSRWLRVAGAAVAVPLAAGLALTLSRGAIAAAGAGLVSLLLLRATRAQLRAAAVTAIAGAAAGAVALSLDGVRTLAGGGSTRQLQGALLLAILAGLMALAGAIAARRLPPQPAARGRRGARLGALGAAAAVAGLVLALGLVGGPAVGTPESGARVGRLASVESNRYAYWEVALGQWRGHPLAGAGAGAFRVAWLAERDVDERALDAHSLYLETLAELGLIGLALLGVFAAAIVAGARASLPATAGSVAALAAFATHAGLDWDWEMPAVTLVALLLAAGVVVAGGRPGPAATGPRPRE